MLPGCIKSPWDGHLLRTQKEEHILLSSPSIGFIVLQLSKSPPMGEAIQLLALTTTRTRTVKRGLDLGKARRLLGWSSGRQGDGTPCWQSLSVTDADFRVTNSKSPTTPPPPPFQALKDAGKATPGSSRCVAFLFNATTLGIR